MSRKRGSAHLLWHLKERNKKKNRKKKENKKRKHV
jgi:hypothetical protein